MENYNSEYTSKCQCRQCKFLKQFKKFCKAKCIPQRIVPKPAALQSLQQVE